MTKRSAAVDQRPDSQKKKAKTTGSGTATTSVAASVADLEQDGRGRQQIAGKHAATSALPLDPRRSPSAPISTAAPAASGPLGPNKELSTEQIKQILGITHRPQSCTNNITPSPPPTPHEHDIQHTTHNKNQHTAATQHITTTYTMQDKAPYYIIMKKENINDILAAKTLMSNKIDGVVAIRTLTQNTIRVQCKSREVANQLVCSSAINAEYKCFIPNGFVKSVGVIRGVPLEVTEEDFDQFLESPTPVETVERINYWDRAENRAKPGTSVKLTFRSQNIPNEVKLLYVVKKVELFVPKPVLCNKCLRYGHIAKSCRSRDTVCTNCSTITHAFGDPSCNGSCDHCKRSCTPTCRHCTTNTNHRTNSNTCPVMKAQIKIKEHMTKNKCTYHETKIYFESVSEHGAGTYAGVTKLTEENKNLRTRLHDAENLLQNLLSNMQAAAPASTQHLSQPDTSITSQSPDAAQLSMLQDNRERIKQHFVKHNSIPIAINQNPKPPPIQNPIQNPPT